MATRRARSTTVYPVIQCPGCGDDVVIKRGSEAEERMCARCQRIARDDAKKQATKAFQVEKSSRPTLVPLYDRLGFCIGHGEVWNESGAGSLAKGWYTKTHLGQLGPYETRALAIGSPEGTRSGSFKRRSRRSSRRGSRRSRRTK